MREKGQADNEHLQQEMGGWRQNAGTLDRRGRA